MSATHHPAERPSPAPNVNLIRLPLAPPAPAAPPDHHSVVGAAPLDLMAAIAGPAWAPDHGRAWSAAFEVVRGAMPAGAAARGLAAVA
jgi:hypothetical protein